MDSTPSELLLGRLLAHPSNAPLLSFLDVTSDLSPYFTPWDDSGFDEGGSIFFGYAAALPLDTKYTLNTVNVLVLPTNGLVFGVHFGRCTFIHRCDFARSGIANSDRLRVAVTLDDQIDVRSLGEDWAILNGFVEDEPEQLLWSYELSRGIGDSPLA